MAATKDFRTKKYYSNVLRLAGIKEIVAYRESGFITKEDDNYIFNALADMDCKKWRVAFTKNINEQYQDY